jgi:sialate O-acetylesterase
MNNTRFLSLLAITLIINSMYVLNAQNILIGENFEMVAGSTVSGQNDWTAGATSTNRVIVASEGLTYPDYPGSGVGLAASFIPTTDRIQRTFAGSMTGSYFYSFLIKVSAAGSGDFFAGFFSNSAFRGRVYLKSDGNGFQFGLTKTTTGPVVYTSSTPYSFGTTYLIVVQYKFNSGSGTDDEVSMYINPDLTAASPGTPTVGPLTDTGNDVTANVFALQGRANSGTFILDGLKVAPDWASIRGEASKNHFIELPKFISPNMVLQRETPLQFRGWGSENDTIKVTLNRQGILYADSAVIGTDGRWEVTLPAQDASAEACTLTFELTNNPETNHSLGNILIGDVWFAGGQSNMEKKVSHLLEATQVIADADNYPLIRSFRASYFATNEPQERVNGSSAPWFVCNSTEVGEKVSAVAYIFALEIYKSQNIPIGIMQSYRGGTELETWMSGAKISSDPELCKVSGRIVGMDPANANNYHSINYNGQIHPLTGFPIKGFLFYQGESNTKRALEYRLMMKKLIEDWREKWGMGNLPFYYVQMFNMGISVNQLYEEGNWQDIREQQEQLLTVENIPNIGMAVSIDTNEDPNHPDDNIRIHPRNKLPVGERLAKIALKNTYNTDIVGESPILSHYKFSNDTAFLVFKNYGSGLKIKTGDSELKGFAMAGPDKSFKTAIAEIINDSTLAVTSSLVEEPVSVRYGWAKNPICNLYNSDELPASPFRTDNWNSGFTYQSFPSTCAASNDAGLIVIRVNGVALPGFNTAILNYQLSEIFQQPPAIVGFTNNPFASIVSSTAGNNSLISEKLTVTAENGTQQTYEISYNIQTSSANIAFSENVLINLINNKLNINNELFEDVGFSLFSSTGQILSQGKIENNSNRSITISQNGIYLVQVFTKSATLQKKIMMLTH